MKHPIDHQIQDYLDGELAPADANRVRRHLETCDACRKEMEAMRALVGNVQALPRSLDPPRDLWAGIEAEIRAPREADAMRPPVQGMGDRVDSRKGGRVGDRARRAAGRAPRRLAVGIGVAAVAIALVLLVGAPDTGWDVAVLQGSPTLARDAMSEAGILRPGEWLETDGASAARIRVGAIGNVEVGANTRLQLRSARIDDHRIALAEGRIEARIWAPPRLFFVETPAATAIDLGCAYTLEVDSAGRSLLHVTAGYVQLQRGDHGAIVPAGALAYATREDGPGTAFSEDASSAFRNALFRYDFDGRSSADLDTVLREARRADALSLWQLVERTRSEAREHVYERLVELVEPPAGVTREGILNGDEEMFEMWRLRLDLDAVSWWGYLRQKMAFPDE